MLTNLGRLVRDQLTAQVGAVGVWAKRRGQDSTLPAVVYDLQVGPTIEGSAPVSSVLIVVSCYAPTSLGVETVAGSVQSALQGWSGRAYGVALLELDLTNSQQDFDEEKSEFYAVLSFSATAITGG
jgi:hypothetical protein